MKDTIALPIASLAHTVDAPPRCFMVFDDYAREVSPYPFTEENCRKQWEAIKEVDQVYGYISDWCATLWFPEAWPPDLIKEFLESRTWQTTLLG